MKVKLFASWIQYKWQDAPTLQFDVNQRLPYASPDTAQIPAGEFEVDLDILPLDRTEMTKKRVAVLRQQQGTLQAKITDIDRQISELLSIEHKPGGEQ